MKSFKLEIISPYRQFLSTKVVSVTFSTHDGRMEILSDHEDIVVPLVPCLVELTLENGEKKQGFTGSGIVTVVSNAVCLLADAAEYPDEIDLERAVEAKKRALERIKDAFDAHSKKRAQRALKRAEARIHVQSYSIKEEAVHVPKNR